MPQIGTFKKTKDGFTGRIRTLTLDAELAIRSAENTDAENAPHYRIFTTDDIETGAGWKRTGESWRLPFARHRRSVLHPADPRSPVPVGNRQRDLNLLWARPSKRDERT